ncbi:hypothetical protein OPKNFCMD_5886 [Methylobacterium crusticola]|uniref:O-antigen ligase-related domain-containing protein n=1 Tax=Methylobacterium crusticola TaxID=1697972 RepID=A0ABQ4R5X6_9HYPH|nr:O-antigen ligase family protein [Methylobacterium crusticola]GJD53115.1 hypothetical protein OPKNFCMD_5886 [Methylobacterium crusticola]
MLIVASAVLIILAWICGARRFAEAVLLTRSVCDPLFSLTKAAGREDVGLGAAINIAVIVVALGCILNRRRVSVGPAASLWLPFLAVCLAAVPIAPDPTAAFRLYMIFVTHAAICLLAFYFVHSLADLRRFLLIILAGSLLPTLYALIQLAFGWAETEDGTRVLSTFAHANIYAYYLITMLALVFTLLAEPRFELSRRLRRGLTLYVPLLLFLILMTKTRSAWVATCVILGMYALLFDRRVLLYFLAAPALLVVMPEIAARIADLQDGNYNEAYAKLNSYTWRLLLWQSAFEWIWEKPILGWGLEAFAHYVAQFFPMHIDNDTIDSHSVYVQLLFETGVLGLAAFAWIYVRLTVIMARAVMQGYRWTWMILSLIFGYLFMCYSDNMLYYLIPTWYMWFALGSVCALLRTHQMERSRARQMRSNLRAAVA